MTRVRGPLAGVAILLLAPIALAGAETIRFEDATAAALADLVPYPPANLRVESVADAIGSGFAVADFDADGRLDIYLAAPVPGRLAGDGGSGRLLRQLAAGTFEDATARAGAWGPPLASGAAAADYDGDGFIDLVVTGRGGTRLLRNSGGRGFEDVTRGAAIVGPGWGTTPLFFDADADGKLDLLLPSFVELDTERRVFYRPDGFPAPAAYMPAAPRFFRNLGNGTFTDATRAARLDLPMRALGALAFDHDLDGKTDLYFACEGMQSELFRGLGDGTFSRTGPATGLWYPAGGEGSGFHGVAVWSGAGEGGRPGMLVTDGGFGALFRPVRPPAYEDRSVASGLAAAIGSAPGWGCAVADFDADGEEDLFVTRGGFAHPAPAESRVLKGLGQGELRDVTDTAGPALRTRTVGRASAAVDLDGDGTLDILETALDRPLRILRGTRPSANRVLRLSLGAGAVPGTRVEVTAGGRTWSRQITAGGYLSSVPPLVHVGLGPRDSLDSVRVVWPSGKFQDVDVTGIPAAVVEVHQP
ncbi:MAG: CRTAC1 family protein [Candidatus Wallbacteria bacterium]|nr:CRTAC1 family protein [Candidatus Wallbacteria bacterium]